MKSEIPVDGLHNLAYWNLVLHKFYTKKTQKKHKRVLYSVLSNVKAFADIDESRILRFKEV